MQKRHEEENPGSSVESEQHSGESPTTLSLLAMDATHRLEILAETMNLERRNFQEKTYDETEEVPSEFECNPDPDALCAATAKTAIDGAIANPEFSVPTRDSSDSGETAEETELFSSLTDLITRISNKNQETYPLSVIGQGTTDNSESKQLMDLPSHQSGDGGCSARSLTMPFLHSQHQSEGTHFAAHDRRKVSPTRPTDLNVALRTTSHQFSQSDSDDILKCKTYVITEVPPVKKAKLSTEHPTEKSSGSSGSSGTKSESASTSQSVKSCPTSVEILTGSSGTSDEKPSDSVYQKMSSIGPKISVTFDFAAEEKIQSTPETDSQPSAVHLANKEDSKEKDICKPIYFNKLSPSLDSTEAAGALEGHDLINKVEKEHLESLEENNQIVDGDSKDAKHSSSNQNQD